MAELVAVLPFVAAILAALVIEATGAPREPVLLGLFAGFLLALLLEAMPLVRVVLTVAAAYQAIPLAQVAYETGQMRRWNRIGRRAHKRDAIIRRMQWTPVSCNRGEIPEPRHRPPRKSHLTIA